MGWYGRGAFVAVFALSSFVFRLVVSSGSCSIYSGKGMFTKWGLLAPCQSTQNIRVFPIISYLSK